MALALGVPEFKLNSPEMQSRVLQYLAERYSSDRFCNRLSDFFGTIASISFGLSYLAQFGVLVTAIWLVIDGDHSAATASWLSVVIFYLTYVWAFVFNFLCRLLTGRLPGEAKSYRKTLAQSLSHVAP